MHVHQMEVKTAFLNSDLGVDIYMQQPHQYVDARCLADFFCKLKKSLYGLKQSSRIWNKKIDGFMISLSFDKFESYHYAYVMCKVNEGIEGNLLFAVPYVDDHIIACN
uniref:Reverse transcriptase Ty1/copia-type domain-containing protein n=1 Tax=Peronospora matthiolae TaxID=2874970 RepID=A0AAV1T9C1_9STRA